MKNRTYFTLDSNLLVRYSPCMRLVVLFTCIAFSLNLVSCGFNDNVPDAAPVTTATPVQASRPMVNLPANFPMRPLALPPAPPVTPRCASACVMDALTGRVLYAHNANQRRQVASTQKILTALVVLDHGSLNDKIIIQPSDTQADPTKLGLRSGQVYSKQTLLQALMVKSYNDVALALARDTAGSVPRFINMMNTKARSMGMNNSKFSNPNGLPADQYSTAMDMARCAYFAYRNPALRSMVNASQMTFQMPSGRISTIKNTNKLLDQYSWVTGMKTGYTNAAGRCLVSTGCHNGKHAIVVVLGSKPAQIWSESEKLLRWALQNS